VRGLGFRGLRVEVWGLGCLLRQSGGEGAGAVGGSVVDDDDLPVSKALLGSGGVQGSRG